jgi:alkanesulfonate monooxygenase SsuD/methylene tetrahydromethanopterin reductase-like flavin-dependent oxidoreductase (luciferase family)
VRLGLALPHAEGAVGPVTGEAVLAAARRVEEAGFASLWCFDAIGRGFIVPDPLVALAAAAAATRRVELGTCILQVPLRRPVELARSVLTTHLLAGGRLLLGVGAGSTRDDFEAVGVDFDRRMALLGEGLDVMRRLWRGERVGAAALSPWPAALGGPPVLIGSWSGEHWIPRAAREFDGWIGSGHRSSFATFAEGIRRYRAAGGTRAILTNVPVDLAAPTGPLPDDVPFHLRCAPDEAARRLRRVAELGFDDCVLVAARAGAGDLAAIRRLLD